MILAAAIDDVSYAHPGADLPSLERVSIQIAAGEAVAILGPSGAGKTTLLALLDGRLRGWLGRVSVLGTQLDPDQRPPREQCADTGFIFQEFALVERSTVFRNVLNGRLGRMPCLRAAFGSPSTRDCEIARTALADCGIADLADRRVDSLSGGQRQRVAIARCLAQEPKLILADEPVSNLDPVRAVDILTLLTKVARARGAAILFSSHQPDLAGRFADRIVGLRSGSILFSIPAAQLSEDRTTALYRQEVSVSGVSLRAVN